MRHVGTVAVTLVEIVGDAISCWQSLLGFVAGLPEKSSRLVCINVTPEMFHLRKLLEICIASDRIKVAARLPRFSCTGRGPAFMNSLGTTPEPHTSATVVQGFIDLAREVPVHRPCCQYWFIETSRDLRRLSLLLNTPFFGSDTAGNGSNLISLPLSRWMSSEMCREYLFRGFVV